MLNLFEQQQTNESDSYRGKYGEDDCNKVHENRLRGEAVSDPSDEQIFDRETAVKIYRSFAVEYGDVNPDVSGSSEIFVAKFHWVSG